VDHTTYFAPYQLIYRQRTTGFQTFFWCIKTSPFACVATTKTILNKSGVNPGQGASRDGKIEPSISVLISYPFHEQGYKYHLPAL
jgi:hypothetical protein